MTSNNNKTLPKIKPIKACIAIESLVNKLVIRGENKRECAEFVSKLVQELGPRTEMDKLLAEKIIFLWWKLRRLFEIERLMLTEQNQPKTKHDDWGDLIVKRRVRNLENVKIYSPEIQEVVSQQVAIEKALSKTLEQYNANKHRQA